MARAQKPELLVPWVTQFEIIKSMVTFKTQLWTNMPLSSFQNHIYICFFLLETINESLFSCFKLEPTNLTTFVSLRYGAPSRRLGACKPTKMHLDIFRDWLLRGRMIAFRLAAGNFYLVNSLPNVAIPCTYFLKIAEHIIKWLFKPTFKA